jgi:hypothetical protein
MYNGGTCRRLGVDVASSIVLGRRPGVSVDVACRAALSTGKRYSAASGFVAVRRLLRSAVCCGSVCCYR